MKHEVFHLFFFFHLLCTSVWVRYSIPLGLVQREDVLLLSRENLTPLRTGQTPEVVVESSIQSNLVKTNFKGPAEMVRLDESSSYPEQATTATCRS